MWLYMKFYLYEHQHKGKPYKQALLDAGFIKDLEYPDVILIDRDWFMANEKEPRQEILQHPDAAVIVYPHSALPPWWYDGLIRIQDYVKCILVIGEGQKRAMKVIAPDARVEAVGWSWCDILPFNARPVHKILFAPIHPAGGRLRPEAKEANERIFRDLRDSSYDVTIRYIGGLRKQGIRTPNRFRMVEGSFDASTKEIDEADLVIAEGSMMYLASARGKPVIGINQHLPVRANKKSDIYTPRNWSKYGADIAYPVNYGDAPLDELIARAMVEPVQWRRDFIGDKMDAGEFVRLVERITNEQKDC
jgi:hypothetical protein